MNVQPLVPRLAAPALLNRKAVMIGLPLLLLVPFFLPIPMVLRRHPLIGHLGDQVHVPFLMALTLLMYWRGPLTGRLKPAVLAAVILGGGIEFVQILVGRAALLADFFLDLAGITLAVGLVLWKGHQNRMGLAIIILIFGVLSSQLYFLPGLVMGSYHARQSFPVVSDFEGPHEQWLWSSSYDAQLDIISIPDSPRGPGHVLRIESGPPSRWPGAQMKHFPHNWSVFKTLTFDVRHVTPNRETVPFSLRLDDYRSRRDQTWVNNRFTATSEWKTFSMTVNQRQVSHGERIMELQDMSHLLVFLSDKKDSTVIQIDNLRLD